MTAAASGDGRADPLADHCPAISIVAASELTPLTSTQVQLLRNQYPSIPDGYFEYLETIGYGSCKSGSSVYSGPVHPVEIYGDRLADSPIRILGDDFMGYCFGFDTARHEYGELSPSGEWEPWPPGTDFLDHVSPDADRAR